MTAGTGPATSAGSFCTPVFVPEVVPVFPVLSPLPVMASANWSVLLTRPTTFARRLRTGL
ncbi:hypothetical protein GCM10009593_29470 [Microlunatus antarcticus]